MKTYIIMWDCYGLEGLLDITKQVKQYTLSLLNDGKNLPSVPGFNNMILRAQINRHRPYEIYALTVEDEFDIDEIERLFETNPQQIVNLIRERGSQLFSNYDPNEKRLIT